jgi:hypothetical protein
MGRGDEGRLAEHSVHRCRTAAALQMRPMAQMIVSCGAILSFNALFKEIGRLAGREPAHKCRRQWINLFTIERPVVMYLSIRASRSTTPKFPLLNTSRPTACLKVYFQQSLKQSIFGILI